MDDAVQAENEITQALYYVGVAIEDLADKATHDNIVNADEAMRVLQLKKIDEVPVVDKIDRPIGLVDVQDLLKAGLV